MNPVYFWFRRDLRLHDNTGLYHALESGRPVLPVFIFDSHILEALEDQDDSRVHFIHNELVKIDSRLRAQGSGLIVRHGKPENVWPDLFEVYGKGEIYGNRDTEPYALSRDDKINRMTGALRLYKDQVIFDENEILKQDRTPYTIYTPYRKQWRLAFNTNDLQHYASERHADAFARYKPDPVPSLKDLGFKPGRMEFPEPDISIDLVRNYHKTRDFPALRGTTRIGVHLRFGTVSVRDLVERAAVENETWLDELIWREFFMMILSHHPRVVDHAFKPAYDNIQWRNDEDEFESWKQGRTGFPLVDAGMRELNTSGFMHNRVRMVAASFLCKDLLIDWRWGERYFARRLLDYDLAANNGNWQWAAGTGCDAAPYFRVFNPQTQMKKFDPKCEYTARWVPEQGSDDYPAPMVDHASARLHAIATYRSALAS